MTPIIITLSLLISSKQGRINSGTDLGTGYGGTVCGFHTRPYRTVVGILPAVWCRLLKRMFLLSVHFAVPLFNMFLLFYLFFLFIFFQYCTHFFVQHYIKYIHT